ncbi:MAG: signal recognition particle receptor subunit beta [Planctomycetota bacterium]|jgi:signal recognition particle receptor subunit beta
MVQINFAQKTVNVKVVYYGPGMSGKTTNLEVVHQRAPDTNRGDLTSISTDGDRTLFFDYMPLSLGTVAGMKTCFQIYTVPGQVYYNSTRKLVLQGVDGIIFVADSASSMIDQNLEALRNLEENLNEYGKSLATLPHVVQWNKRDLPDAMAPEELSKLMNPHGAPAFEAVANTGEGVFPTLKALAALVLKNIMKETTGGGASPSPPQNPAGATPGAAPVSAAPQFAAPAQSAPAVNLAAPAAPAQKQQPAMAQGLDLQTAPVRLAPQATPSQLMQGAPAVAQVAPRPRQARPTAQPAQTRRPAAGKSAGKRAPVAPPKKKSGALTGVFVVAAAGVGAALAYFLLTAL